MAVGEPKVSERARYSLAAEGVERSPAEVRQRTDASMRPRYTCPINIYGSLAAESRSVPHALPTTA
jgi:hypothetical protein